MPNPYGAPEISVHEVARKLKDGEDFILLDVREPEELDRAKLPDGQFILLPLSRLAAEQSSSLPEAARDQDAEIVIMCRSGVRSAQVTAWLLQQGWTNVLNMDGGILAYGREIDPSIKPY